MTDETFLLDLLNSTPVVDGTQRDVLDADWLRAHDGTGSADELAAVREARDVLQALVRGETEPGALTPLLAGVVRHPSVTSDGVEWTVDVADARRTAVRAVLAWDVVHRTSPGRLRPCANLDCRLFLIDHSKPNKARWCSMAVCGNRMKARRHYERTRGN
jgi:predicted RNA-binding Zn ribbon-like protein